MMYIPKTIHMIWFGKNEYSRNTKKCIESWKLNCPEYEIKLWNEQNCDIEENSFIKEAASVGKWAFVSDYIRLKILYEYGGVYVDTDIEIIKPIDSVLEDRHVVTGYASANMISSGFIASEKGNPWIKHLMDYYEDKHFILDDGTYNMKINNLIIAQVSSRFGFSPGDTFINEGKVCLMPREYFQPYTSHPCDWNNKRIEEMKKYYDITPETYCIHYCAASWDSKKGCIRKIKRFTRRILPRRIIEEIEKKYYWHKNWNT